MPARKDRIPPRPGQPMIIYAIDGLLGLSLVDLLERQVYGSHIKMRCGREPMPYSSSGEKLSLQVVWQFETQAERSNVFGLREES